MKKFLKKKYSSSVVMMLVLVAVVVTGLVMYVTLVSGLNQTKSESQAGPNTCAYFCSTKMKAANVTACTTLCTEVEAGESTCAELCDLNRNRNFPPSSCLKSCSDITPLGRWCNNVPCLNPNGNREICTSVCLNVNNGMTCAAACDQRFPGMGGALSDTQTKANISCKKQCPQWIMPVPSPTATP